MHGLRLRKLRPALYTIAETVVFSSFVRPYTMATQNLSCKALLLDIYGVVYMGHGNEAMGGEAIPGSVEAVKLLRQARFPFRFLSNQSTVTRDMLAQKLRAVGIDVKADDITALAPLAAKVIKERGLRPFFLVKEEVMEEFHDINTVNPNCVVLGDAQENFSYENVNRAFSVLINCPKPVLISMGSGKYYRKTDGLRIDVGAYCKGLEYATGVKAEYLGKPDPAYFASAVEQLKVPAQECIMVGDDINTDIEGAKKAGMRAVLVRTGKYRPGDENKATSKPDFVMDNLLDVVKAVLKR